MSGMGRPSKAVLRALYARLFRAFGPQQWWPGETPFEVIIGAILTQNTNWGNVEKAIFNLKSKKLLSPRALNKITYAELSALIKPAGYFNVKAKRLKSFIAFLYKEYKGDLTKMAAEDHAQLRKKLLGVNGIGPETADSILLYAFGKPVFVVDAYTKRVLYRHNMAGLKDDYHAIQEKFMKALGADVRTFNEYHALIVRLGKDYCKPNPKCTNCILKDFHYSLAAKCASCHRALPDKRERKRHGGGYLCRFSCQNR